MTRTVTIGASLVVVLSACDDGPLSPDTPIPIPDARPYVVGAALDNVDSNGHFRFPDPYVESPYPIIARESARDIAAGVIRTWFVNENTLGGMESLAEAREREHGATIDWPKVRPGPREAYFAESHLEPLPATFGYSAIRHFGPFYLVPMYEGNRPVVVVGVAAYATNVSLDSSGRIVKSDTVAGGGEFWVLGIPLSLNGTTVPPAPEAAVEFAFQQTGVKVSEVPVLGVPGNHVVPNEARWQIVMARAIAFERIVDGQPVTTDTIYVGVTPSIADYRLGFDAPLSPHWRIFVRAEQQPSTEDVGGVLVPIRPGYAVDLHEVRVR